MHYALPTRLATRTLWLLTWTLAALTLTACADDDAPNGPIGGNPSLALQLSHNQLTVPQGESKTATLTVTRHQLPTGMVSLTVEGLPPGVGVEFTPMDLDPNTTTSTVTISPFVSKTPGTFTLTIRATGSTTITATKELTVTVTARPQVPVASVEIVNVPNTLEAFDSHQFTAVLKDANGSVLQGREVTWATSNPLVAIVNTSTGALMGIDRGSVTVTATAEGKTASREIDVLVRYKQIAVGSMHACDLSSGGQIWCWGLNSVEGRIGSPTRVPGSMSVIPIRVPLPESAGQLSSFAQHTCAVTISFKAYCWGSNAWGELGAGSNDGRSHIPLRVAGNLQFKQISAGNDHTCGVTLSDQAYCWGNNNWGQLGTGTVTPSIVPVPVSGGLTFKSIAAGDAFTCGVTAANEAYCWGASSLGQLGDGLPISYGSTFQPTPGKVVGGLPLFSLSLGSLYACATTPARIGYCWGDNGGGMLGNGGGPDQAAPVRIAGVFAFRSIAAGLTHACAITQTDAVYCWGANRNGQLGFSAPGGVSAPTPIDAPLTVSEVDAAGGSIGIAAHTCAIALNRLTVWCWGRNDVGQLGNGTVTAGTTANPTPSIVTGQQPLP